MVTGLKLTGIGDAVGALLPEHLLVRLGLREGASPFPVEAPDGLSLSPSGRPAR